MNRMPSIVDILKFVSGLRRVLSSLEEEANEFNDDIKLYVGLRLMKLAV